MIALQSLKYKIFEWCLDTLVDKLINNLYMWNLEGRNKKELDPEDIKKGMLIDEIICIRQGWTYLHRYRKCKIIGVLDLTYGVGRKTINFIPELERIGMEVDWIVTDGWTRNWTVGDSDTMIQFYQYL